LNGDIEMKDDVEEKGDNKNSLQKIVLLGNQMDNQSQLLYFLDGLLLKRFPLPSLASAISLVNYNANEIIVIQFVDGNVGIYSSDFLDNSVKYGESSKQSQNQELKCIYSTFKSNPSILA